MKSLKKYLLLAFTACVLFMVSACGGSKPGDVAVEFTQAMIDGNADKCFSYLYLDEMEAAQKDFAKGKINVMVKGTSEQIKARGGVKSVKLVDVTDDKTDEKRKSARVELTLNDGESKIDSFNLIKDKKGEWKILL